MAFSDGDTPTASSGGHVGFVLVRPGGALLAGLTADALGVRAAIGLVAALTFASGVVVASRMRETLGRPRT